MRPAAGRNLLIVVLIAVDPPPRPTYTFDAVNRRKRLIAGGILLWGTLLALWVARPYFLHPADRVHEDDESYAYAGRLVEFRDLLGAGYLSPQWCTHFRGGLGAPYFSYYQPGFFYAAATVPWSVSPVRALGIAVLGFAILGYLAMYGLVAPRFGRLSGCLAASGLLLSVYVGTEISIRGDLSEFAAMMMLPAVLWALAGSLEVGRGKGEGGRVKGEESSGDSPRPSPLAPHLACLSLSAAALIVLHPAVALVGFGLLGLALIGFALETGKLSRVAVAAAAIAVGIGLAAFYWFPVFFEWELVASEAAFEGVYNYAGHFIHPLNLLEGYRRQKPIPLTLGPVLPLLVLLNLIVFCRHRGKMTAQQRRLFVFCLLAAVLLTLLMTRTAAPLWASIRPLQRLQFPWRILSLLTVLTATAAGAMLPWRREKLRAAVVVLALGAMCGLSWQYTAYRLDEEFTAPDNVEQLVQRNFIPDLCNEWLPRGASKEISPERRTRPAPGPGCQAARFRRTQGRLDCRVETSEPSYVVLPHYFFPVGWRAALDGRGIEIRPGRRGLMRIDLPADCQGDLEVVFSRTPMRAAGLWVSALSLLTGIALLAGICYLGGGRQMASSFNPKP